MGSLAQQMGVITVLFSSLKGGGKDSFVRYPVERM
jgi:hypothetical protein